MCGIAGFLTASPAAGDLKTLERMTNVIGHRGPNGSGYFSDPGLYLGHRRLSVVDLAGGAQPMANEDESIWVTYNGEIFNHAALRPALEAAGHRYKSHCDTETILHAWEQHGTSCVSLFRGMFAFALWDRKTRSLFCVRDRLGIKPFYYYWDGRTFAFASEIKALLQHPAVSANFEDSLLAEHLAFGYTSCDRTLFRNIRKLMPGHYLTISLRDGSGPHIERYWDIPNSQATPSGEAQRPDSEWIRECRDRLEETVRMRLMADVPLGVFLSGGVDSSAIASLITRMTEGDRVKTFSVGYAETPYSELSWARQVSQMIGSEHREVVIGVDDFFNSLPNLIWHEDEPISWPSSISLYFVSRLAAQHVTVVLTGEGSDECFAGYERYQHYLWNDRWMRGYQSVPGHLRSLIRHKIETSSLIGGNLRRKLQHTFLGRENVVESLQLDNFYCAFSEAEQRLLLLDPGQAGNAYRSYLSFWDQSRPLLSRMLYADQKTYMVELLMKQDQMSMATSIESRVPFLDHTFVEFASRVPDDLKVRNGVAKYILKKAVEDILPHEIIYRQKMGFPTPLRQWLREERSQALFSLLTDPSGLLAGYLDLKSVAGLLNRHQRGIEDATDRIWRLLNLQIWGDLYIRGKTSHRLEGLFPKAAATV